MKTIINILRRPISALFKISTILLATILFLISPSCQKEKLTRDFLSEMDLISFSELSISSSGTYYYSPETFTAGFRQIFKENRDLFNQDFKYFENFVLQVQNGISIKTTVSEVEIKINGVLIISTADFLKNENVVSKAIYGLTAESILEVSIMGPAGSFIELMIEGIIKEGMDEIVTDVDGNYYHTRKIGNQVWMEENFKSKKYNDNTLIPNITDNSSWANSTTGAYCWYLNDEATYKPVTGALYNWYAVNTGKLCPTGWHVPSDEEWHTLVLSFDPDAQNILGTESSIAGGKLKETSTNYWQSPNIGATNESGFSAIPGGLRNSVGICQKIQIDGYAFFWSPAVIIHSQDHKRLWEVFENQLWLSKTRTNNAYCRMIGYNAADIYRKSGSKVDGMSIRCIKD